MAFQPRRRAPAMDPQERRLALVQTTLPLLAEHGAQVSTSQIAQAAGVAEGTIFRAFGSKKDLFVACAQSMFVLDDLLAQINSIDQNAPLLQRLMVVEHAVGEYVERTVAVVRAVFAAGVSEREYVPENHLSEADKQTAVLVAATATVFEAEKRLRIAPTQAAHIFLGMISANRMHGQQLGLPAASVEELVDVFLHGVLHAE
jgi:AcrR family transcriptional regulator